jgi:hypothetical protein
MAKKAKKAGPGAVIGGMLAGFDQQVFRTTPPAHELVHHARPDDPVPTKDGGLLVIGMPDLSIPVRGGEPEPAERGAERDAARPAPSGEASRQAEGAPAADVRR